MAFTIISGTGILGIILGIAFRDLVENFLASILLSLQHPFRIHDLIDLVCPVTGYAATGYVESLTMRATILLSLDGSHIQIPNATVYKSNIVNHSSNPIHKESFMIAIDFNHSILKAIDAILQVFVKNEDILKKPQPLVLVKQVEKESSHLQVCYWLDIKKNDPDKVKSSIMRFVRIALQEAGIYQASKQSETSLLPNEKKLLESEMEKSPSEIKTKEDQPSEKIKDLTQKGRPTENDKNLLTPNEQPPKNTDS